MTPRFKSFCYDGIAACILRLQRMLYRCNHMDEIYSIIFQMLSKDLRTAC